jgi:hypothetical protein
MAPAIEEFRAAIGAGDLAAVKRMTKADRRLLNVVINPDRNYRVSALSNHTRRAGP